MVVVRREALPVRSDSDVVLVRKAVRAWAEEIGLGLVDLTKTVTAASELARNALEHGGGGDALLEEVLEGSRRGLRLTVTDRGPGIADVAQAMRDGYSSTGGLGLGLGGTRRLVSEFEIESQPGRGTRVTVTRWR